MKSRRNKTGLREELERTWTATVVLVDTETLTAVRVVFLRFHGRSLSIRVWRKEN